MNLGDFLGRPDLTEKFVLQKFLCEFLHCSREELWTTMDKEVSDEVIQKVMVAYKSYIEDKKPLEYILGHVDFFGKEFFVNEATLIPRPETEYMITAVTENIQGQGTRNKEQEVITVSQVPSPKSPKNILLDIGTGCGVLGISVLLQNPDYFSQAIFTDYFANALEVAKKNYANLVKEYSGTVEFLQADLLDFLVNKSSGSSSLATSFVKEDFSGNVVLVANLPYIPEKTFEDNVADNVKKWEPKPAFVGGEDGLDYYRTMFDQLLDIRHKYQDIRLNQKTHQQNLDTGYLIPITMFLEMMTRQVDILRQKYGEKFVFEEVKTFHFNIRIVKVYIK